MFIVRSSETTEENVDEDTFKGKMKALIKEISDILKELSEVCLCNQ